MVQHHRHTDACKSIARNLVEQLDSKVPKRTAATIKNHLKRCPNCTAYFDSLKKTILLYRCYPDPHAPARMRQKLLAILHFRP